MTEALPDINEKMEAYLGMLGNLKISQEERSKFLDTLGFKNDKDRFKFIAAVSLMHFNRSFPPLKKLKR